MKILSTSVSANSRNLLSKLLSTENRQSRAPEKRKKTSKLWLSLVSLNSARLLFAAMQILLMLRHAKFLEENSKGFRTWIMFYPALRI
jgi:hypothetical protein